MSSAGDFIFIPAGPFLMGTVVGTHQSKTDEEEPQRQIMLDDFYIGRYPVTAAQYQSFVSKTGRSTPRYQSDVRFNSSLMPIVGVTWYDAVAFCDWLSTENNQNFRLPTEAEWEKSARGVDGRQYIWGDQWKPNQANFAESSFKQLVQVGFYEKNVSSYGCQDMVGNCYQWCSDWFHAETYKYSPNINPKGAKDGRRKVIRGGSWNTKGKFSGRCANRAAHPPDQAPNWIGFRLAIDEFC